MASEKPKTNKKYIINLLVLVIITIGTLILLLKDDFNEVVDTVLRADLWYIFLIIMAMVIYYLIEGLALTIFAKLYRRSFKFYKGVLNGMIGTFFSGITPSASGGQFAQAYAFKKQGIKISNSASILFMHFIVYELVLVLYVLVTLIFRFNDFTTIMPYTEIAGYRLSFLALTLIGFGINAAVIGGLFFMAYSKLFHRLVLVHGINLLAKLKIIKNKEKVQRQAELQVSMFRREFTKLLTNFKVLVIVAFLQFIKLTVFYSVPYLAAKAVGANVDFGESLIMASYLYMITSFFPIPGASGGSEAFFVIMFKRMISIPGFSLDSIITSIMLIWRFATFYIGLIVGAFVVIFYRESGTKEFVTMANPKIVLTGEISKITISDEDYININKKEENEEEIIQEDGENEE